MMQKIKSKLTTVSLVLGLVSTLSFGGNFISNSLNDVKDNIQNTTQVVKENLTKIQGQSQAELQRTIDGGKEILNGASDHTNVWDNSPSNHGNGARMGYQHQLDRASHSLEDINDLAKGAKKKDLGVYDNSVVKTSFADIVPPNPKIVTSNYHITIHQDPSWGAWTKGGGKYVYDHHKVRKNRYSVYVNGHGRVAHWKQWNGCGDCGRNLNGRFWTNNAGQEQIIAYPACSQGLPSKSWGRGGNCKRSTTIWWRHPTN